MPTLGDVKTATDPTLGPTRLSFANEAEIDVFADTLARFERGELHPDEWRAFRLVHGTYGQRQDGAQMVRVKIPQGILSADQLRALADVAETHSRGFGHITTRQNVQLHFVASEAVEPAMRRLAESGLTTREACGNAVRNITGCPYAGVAADEAFDPTPYAEAMTRTLLRHPLSSTLPRKFKIAFEGCAEDHVATPINDLGFRALVRHGARGFRVTAGGGTATLPTSGRVLWDFLPAGRILEVAESVLRVFHARGDRAHRNRNRLKFLIRELGWETFRGEVDLALERVHVEGGVPLPFDPDRPPVEEAPAGSSRRTPPTIAESARRASGASVHGPGLLPSVQPVAPDAFSRWLRTNARPQKQRGFARVTATLVLGDVTAAQLRLVADLALAYSDGTVRITQTQDLLFRWVPDVEVARLYARLGAAGLGLAGAETIADVTSCPGAESCKLAVTRSRGLGKLLTDHLREDPERADFAEDLKIKISGCPNGCGQHHIAGIGFQGSVRRVGGRAVPQYLLMAGGVVDEAGARFGRVAGRIPARRVPEALDRLLSLYRDERRDGETATAFFARADVPHLRAAVIDLELLTAETARPEDFVDLGDTEAFVPETKEGECAT